MKEINFLRSYASRYKLQISVTLVFLIIRVEQKIKMQVSHFIKQNGKQTRTERENTRWGSPKNAFPN